MNNIRDYLIEADKITYSYQCPYLALAHVVGMMDVYSVKSNPSNFGRLSLNRIMDFIGVKDRKLSNFIYNRIECGYTLREIANRVKCANCGKITHRLNDDYYCGDCN